MCACVHVCGFMCMCTYMCDVIYLVFQRRKSVFFSESFIRIGLFAFVQTDSFLILRVQTFPSVYSSQTFPFDHLCLVCVPLSNGVSLPKKVVIAFEHDLFFYSRIHAVDHSY